jgi:TPR repeat protein
MTFRSMSCCAVSLTGAILLAGSIAVAAPPPPAKETPAAAVKSATDKVCPARKDSYPANYNPAFDNLGIGELTKLADKGNADAMVLLGLMHTPSPERTEAYPPVDLGKALALFERAAKKGHGFGAYLVGVAHMSGTGVPKDDKKALDWFRHSADRGSPVGHFWLAEMIAKGRGLKADWKKALPHFTRAAEGGVFDAYTELGYAYDTGQGGLAQSHESAAYCFRQGAPNSVTSQYNLRLLIDQGHVLWQPGDPGVAPPPK